MKINIIYESQFGNGKKVVEELAAILEEKGQDVSLFPVAEIRPDELPAADLYIFSSPTRKFMLPLTMKRFIKRFDPPSEDIKYALMTTFMDPRTIALKKMEALMSVKGIKKAADDFKVKALGLKGPLEDNYGARLEKFADELIK
ncbi:MAG: flavodoxin family protein [Actinomycetia bacterium]|nr:flavodoxin family protein [Actinomycetes bacterium]